MTSFRNWAVSDTRRRRGINNLTPESFYDLAERLKGQYSAYAMWLSYGPEFQNYYNAEFQDATGKLIKEAYSVKGWSGEVPAFFTDVPVDFDASQNLKVAYEQCKAFVDNELIGKGVDARYFTVYLSGGKGFHIHISASVFNVEQPLANAGYRFKNLAHIWKQTYTTIDLSIYNSTALFRLPGSLHKSGLHKVEIPIELFTLDYLDTKDVWAATPDAKIRIPERGQPPIQLEVPEAHVQQLQQAYDVTDFDSDLWITPNCPWLQSVMDDPSNGGKDGDGREKRRNAVGVLLSTHETSEANDELKWFIGKLESHEYMSEQRLEDVYKWVREYDRDGEIKCAKTCRSIGCSAAQRSLCGTRSPLDWKLKRTPLNVNSPEVKRKENRALLGEIIDGDDNGFHVLNWPVGIGKTHGFTEETKEKDLTVFYTAQTHLLSAQTAANLEAAGIPSRHVASRAYLTENAGFECLFPKEVELAIANGYGSHTVCSKCPRKRKRDQETNEWNPDLGYDACDYFEQFEGLEAVKAVVGVHNHLFEYMYDAADVHKRSITLIDEAPLEALAQTVKAMEPEKLSEIRGAMAKVIEAEKSDALLPAAIPGLKRRGLFSRVAAVMETANQQIIEAEKLSKIPVLTAFQNMYEGQPFDAAFLASMSNDFIRACWYDVANKIAGLLGYTERFELSGETAYLAVPYPVMHAVELVRRGKTYDPSIDQHLPTQLPKNKIVVLDATASADVYAAVFRYLSAGDPDRAFKFYEHGMTEQPYSVVTQITSSSYGVSKLYEKSIIGDLCGVIKMLIRKHPGPSLIVCHKQHESYWRKEMRAFPEIDVATYGSLKGLNHWQKCVAQYIVGTPFVPDSGIAELAAKLGQDVPVHKLQESAALKTQILLAKNGNTAVVSRRVYNGFQFHTSLAQMKSQWEVTQAVRLRLYDKHTEDKQNLYIFSNVELKGMYADEFKTLNELAAELQAVEKDPNAEVMELTGADYDRLNAWFKGVAVGEVFKKANIPDELASENAKTRWLMALAQSGFVEKPNYRAYCKVREI